MLFNSLEYLLFFLVVLSVAWLTAGWQRFRTYFLLVASLYFYASNNSWAIFLLLATTTIDYFISLQLGKTSNPFQRKCLLWISIVSNLGMLGFFKYFNFIGESVGGILSLLGWKADWVDLNILLPVGISFYTFEALSYTIDVYRGKIPPSRDYVRLAFLVSFFPHLIAGPIVRAADFFPQIDRRPRLDIVQLERALMLIACGLIKKIMFADSLAPLADAAFSNPLSIGTWATWIGVYAFAFQIYCDFSGYTDLALGSALLLGYQLPQNFNRPYVSQSVTEFWRRWHISLSTWLRDYLYISLGGNRMKSQWGVYRNLIVTMALGGLWHGAAWNFLIWGFFHGIWLSIERYCGIRGDRYSAGWFLPTLRTFLTFQGIVVLWMIFRVPNMQALRDCTQVMFSFVPGQVTNAMAVAIVFMVLAWAWQIVNEHVDLKEVFLRWPVGVKASIYAGVSVMVLIFNSETPQSFIYFKF